MKNKTVELKNLYTGEIVFAENINDVRPMNGVEFIEVYNEKNPQRKYLVNRFAFVPVTK
jgi:hypothetical protein